MHMFRPLRKISRGLKRFEAPINSSELTRAKSSQLWREFQSLHILAGPPFHSSVIEIVLNSGISFIDMTTCGNVLNRSICETNELDSSVSGGLIEFTSYMASTIIASAVLLSAMPVSIFHIEIEDLGLDSIGIKSVPPREYQSQLSLVEEPGFRIEKLYNLQNSWIWGSLENNSNTHAQLRSKNITSRDVYQEYH